VDGCVVARRVMRASTSPAHPSVISIRHIHPSHPSVTSIRHIHLSHPPVTSIRHIHPSHPSVTSIRHIHPSHPSVTSIRHIHPSHPPVTSTLPSQGGGGGRAEEARGDPRQRGRAAGVHAALCDGGVQPHVLGAATVCVGRCHVQAQINRAEGEKQARVLDSEAERQQMSA
jgi:hypothetical protein